jgi:predicted amidophosphoribosyltransferase
MTLLCPNCQKPLISRISLLCNLCGARVPSDLLFSAEERIKIEADERRAKELLESREAERNKRMKDAAEASI